MTAFTLKDLETAQKKLKDLLKDDDDNVIIYEDTPENREIVKELKKPSK